MPSSPVHLKIAYLMSDQLKIKNKGDFLLGAISPDCVNYGVEQAEEQVRYKAHIRVRDYDKWKLNLMNFYSQNKQNFSSCPDYLKGYLFHIWTDIAWDEAVQPELFEFLYSLGYGYDDITYQKWQELYRFNGLLVKEDIFLQSSQLIKASKPREIAGCSQQLIEKYRDYVANDYSDKIKNDPPLFLSQKQIDDTITQIQKMDLVFSN